ncbi:GyrI-like domain-containing protein [Leifsonia sp. NPDC014704]|uniref:GyrI-like domain-containing protein n=1 Tax=Leifsonia sp. NPDC014704 TaxID=3364123 RepID=UPI0036F4A667
MTVKTDLKKELGLYAPRRGRFEVVTVPPLRYLMVDGHGDPNTSGEYRDAIQTIFPLAYALKFLSKRSLDRDYTVMPLEALWWADDMASFTSARDKSQWHWTALNLVPDWITDAHVEEATATLRSKGGAPRLDELRVETLDEGLSVQTLHVGSYDDEAPVLAELHDVFIPDAGLTMTARHHEIYLSDARRTAPEKLRTILRQPVTRAD